jgi:hypothetical protein
LQNAETQKISTGSGAGKGKKSASKIEKTSEGQSGNPHFLRVAVECGKQRCQIIGVYAPKRTALEGPDGSAILGPAFDRFLEVLARALEPYPGAKQALSAAMGELIRPGVDVSRN